MIKLERASIAYSPSGGFYLLPKRKRKEFLDDLKTLMEDQMDLESVTLVSIQEKKFEKKYKKYHLPGGAMTAEIYAPFDMMTDAPIVDIYEEE